MYVAPRPSIDSFACFDCAPLQQKLDQGHSAPVTSVAWCPHDNKLILTGAEDGRALVWTPPQGQVSQGQVLYELPVSPQYSGVPFDLQWHPRTPGIVSACTGDGKVSVHSVNYIGNLHCPAWLKTGRGNGASFGFGGKMVQFAPDPFYALPEDNQKAAATAAATAGQAHASHHVTVSAVSTEPTLVQRSEAFQGAMHSNDLHAFCDQKHYESLYEQERESWRYIKMLLNPDTVQTELLQSLGYAPSTASSASVPSDPRPSAPAGKKPAAAPPPIESAVPDDDFFASLGQTEPAAVETESAVDADASDSGREAPVAASAASAASSSSFVPEALTFTPSPDAPTSAAAHAKVEASITSALMMGNFAEAVASCLAIGRLTDALVLAARAGPDVWATTQRNVLDRHPHVRPSNSERERESNRTIKIIAAPHFFCFCFLGLFVFVSDLYATRSAPSCIKTLIHLLPRRRRPRGRRLWLSSSPTPKARSTGRCAPLWEIVWWLCCGERVPSVPRRHPRWHGQRIP